MFDVLGALKTFAVRLRPLTLDNAVFRLHYRFTVVLLLAFSVLVSSKQYLGDPIDCLKIGTFRENLVDQYCWVSSTFSVPKACKGQVGTDTVYPCVGKYVEGDQRVGHMYYQWVCFVLFLQALLFYVPHYLWKSWEGGRLKALTTDLAGPMVGDEVKGQRVKAIQAYFHVSLHGHTLYASRFVLCELLNFVNVIAQIFLIDLFLGGEFMTYGSEVLKFTEMDQTDRVDPMVMVFPRVAKCMFYTYGTTGSVQIHDTMCILPINIFNEKIYIAMWFWFIHLAVLSGLALLYRLFTLFSQPLRALLLRRRVRYVNGDDVEAICNRVSYGDWFILYMLAKNIKSTVYQDVVDALVKQLHIYGGPTLKRNDETKFNSN